MITLNTTAVFLIEDMQLHFQFFQFFQFFNCIFNLSVLDSPFLAMHALPNNFLECLCPPGGDSSYKKQIQ